ncbi:hypothetical protein, partial [Verrucomicrobium sp. BvORR034]|uniref:hypothetical protein n=1 Tax=Verrucomicrobium sp. BvORR034 TaxID=1396418 RepID=UPI002240EF0D
MSAIVFDLLASHRDILTESPREGSYLSAAVLRSDYPEYIPNRYLSKGQIISTSALEWLRQFGSLRSHDKEELGVLIPHPGPDASEASHPGPALAAIDIAATYVRLNKFNFSDLALLAGFVKASGTKDWRFTSSDA